MSAKTVEVAGEAAAGTTTILLEKPVAIRVSPNNYLAALFIAAFAAALLVYLEKDRAAIAVFALSWLIFPLLALTDRVAFDGKRLYRTGFLPKLRVKLARANSAFIKISFGSFRKSRSSIERLSSAFSETSGRIL